MTANNFNSIFNVRITISGIFVVTPSIIQSVAGPATCISYLLSGLAAGLSVICYSDLASRFV